MTITRSRVHACIVSSLMVALTFNVISWSCSQMIRRRIAMKSLLFNAPHLRKCVGKPCTDILRRRGTDFLKPFKEGYHREAGIVLAQAEDRLEDVETKDMLSFSNSIDESCTVLNICGRNDTSMLMQCTALLEVKGIVVASANLNAQQDGLVCNIFRITDKDGNKVRDFYFPFATKFD